MHKDSLILVGAGGHCRSCIDVIEQEGRFSIAGIVERSGTDTSGQVLGYPILGTDDDLPTLRGKYGYALVTVGQIESPQPRTRLFERLQELDFELPAIASPLAYVSRHARIGRGTMIMHHALVNAGAVVGENCIINTKALVEHDAMIGDHCHIATGAIVNGEVKIESGSFIGSGSKIREGVTLDKKCFVAILRKGINLTLQNRYIESFSRYSASLVHG